MRTFKIIYWDTRGDKRKIVVESKNLKEARIYAHLFITGLVDIISVEEVTE